MDFNRIGNGGIYKPTILTDAVPSSSSIIGYLINNPIDDCLTSSVHDSGCYSSTADELHLMSSHIASSNSSAKHHNRHHHHYTKHRRLTTDQNDSIYNKNNQLLGNEPFDKVIINVSGLRFETRASTLQRYPHTLLGDKQRRAHFFDSMNNEYFFERHRSSFEAVLYFYQSGGRLARPENISAEIFLEEIKFFDLGEEVLKRYRKQEGYVEEIPVERPVNEFQRFVWEIFECPESSNIARVVAIISIVMIIVSIASFIIETLPSIRNEPLMSLENNVNNTNQFNSLPPGNETRLYWLFFIIETICVTWFSFEFLCRFLVAPSKFAFIKNGPNIIDVVSIIPYFIQLIGLIYQKKDNTVPGFSSTLTVLRIVRLGLQVLALTFLASWKELLLLMFFLFIIVIVFSSFMYFVEADYSSIPPSRTPPIHMPSTSISCPPSTNCLSTYDQNIAPTQANNQFASIPDSFWFSIITMTTVGYGDYVPRTTLGKVIGAACAITGVLTIALPVPIIVSNFTYFYQRQMEDNERQYQARQKAQAANQLALEKRQLYSLNDNDHGPELNEWETTLNEPDYSAYRQITHAVAKKLVHNVYFKAFRGSKKMNPALRYQSLPPSAAPYQITHRIYQLADDKNETDILQ
ncbi:unnamed protein product [Rotaria sp. Silwood2]|nr:unnamed protein product [Rotaria sp. Silwood2]CAF2555968.1 unnamed protein product [Rotaria sp. Silwood2]CAF2818548.1 unnamed protein product [Rotaria sp. Silwood2]CAF2979564.1 unnamed protein product [Rotaria sp. Silwood2]CAF3866907.1 unnamed protein product [Rotaria sp. Silwood2]